MLNLVATRRVTLAGKDYTQYDFEPLDDGSEVQVTITRRHGNERYKLPRGEARELYSRLLNQGYEKF